MLNSIQHRNAVIAFQWLTLVAFCALIVTPLSYAIYRLLSVTDMTLVSSVSSFFSDDETLAALHFTFLEASISTVFTLLIGLPVAWYLGRYKWRRVRITRAILSVPFVTPSIVVAMGFLMLIDPGGILDTIRIDLRLESGIFGDLSTITGGIIQSFYCADCCTCVVQLIACNTFYRANLVNA